MEFTFRKLTQEHAMEIADHWKYPGEYAFYDMTADLEDYEEFTNETLRNENDHYEVFLGSELVGFFCIVPEGENIEVGLGMRPDLCGKGRGRAFLAQILAFVDLNYRYEYCILWVAAFNQRAIKVYHSCGFTDCETELRQTNGGEYNFLKLKKKRKK